MLKTVHQDGSTSRIPSTEEILNIEKDIQSLIERKRRVDMNLIDMEARIYMLEGEHLKQTSSHFGSIVQGLEGYLGGITGTGASGGSHSSHRRHVRDIKDTERVFSNTSSSSARVNHCYTLSS